MKVQNEKEEVAVNFKNLSLFKLLNFVKIKIEVFHDFKETAAETLVIKIYCADILSLASYEIVEFRNEIFCKI